MKKPFRLIIILLFLVGGAGFWWHKKNEILERDDTLILYGNVEIREVDLAFNNSEHLDQIYVEEGDRVTEGQLLATLHQQRVLAEFAVAEAKVDAQNAVVSRLESGSRPEEISQARANVAAAKAKLADAKITFERTKQLLEKKVIPHQSLDDTKASLDTAQANLRVAEETLALLIKGPRQEDIEEAKAILKANEAELSLAREILNDTELYAPDDGIIRDRIHEPGDMITPQTPVFTLALTNPVWVRTYASETVLGRLFLGMTARISTDSYPGKTYQGWVGYLSPTAEFTPKNVETPDLRTRLVYQLRVYVCNPEDELHLGMPTTVTIPLNQAKPESGQAKVPACSKSRDG